MEFDDSGKIALRVGLHCNLRHWFGRTIIQMDDSTPAWIEQGGGRTMPGVEAELGGRPCADEIRAALARMAASDAFRGPPPLSAFFRYVVEATLRGAADRIKGSTIGVGALGGADDFDPQADPIVRVE